MAVEDKKTTDQPLTAHELLQKLNTVSPSFCLAKWTSVSLHLESGMTHSCHNPAVHAIPLQEMSANPAAIHNTSHKISERNKMMNGERPSGCQFCWDIEDLKSFNISDRFYKSARPAAVTRMTRL